MQHGLLFLIETFLCEQGITNVAVQSSVSLQHLPYDKELEKQLPGDVHARLSFALQKLGEMVQAAKKGPELNKKVALEDALPSVGTPGLNLDFN